MSAEKIDAHRLRLGEVWQRLEGICRRLWEENSAGAVSLQAVIEEFQGEVHRVEQMIPAYQRTLEEQRRVITQELEVVYTDRIRTLTAQLEGANARLKSMEESLSKERALAEKLRLDLLAQESENAEFHDRFLKTEAEHDEARARKMDVFFQELTKKGEELEAHWEARHKVLEADHYQRVEALSKSQAEAQELSSRRDEELTRSHERMVAEMTAWESRNRMRDEALLKKDQELANREHQIETEYKRKQREIESIKEALQREVAEIVRQYQARLRQEKQP